MPEYPDIAIYLERLEALLAGQTLKGHRIRSPFLLRTADPPMDILTGRAIAGFSRIGKRLVFDFGDDDYLVVHLMVSGRLHWAPPGAGIPPKRGLAALDFETGTLLITEASSKKRASMHLVRGRRTLEDFESGGLELFDASSREFAQAVRAENHTLKRTLTDPRILSGIGNAYSDEILHRARLSPVMLSSRLSDDEVETLFQACRDVLSEWTDRLRQEVGDGFPAKVTAFRKEMAVHGKYGQDCPVCGSTVQRIRYADRETNYCPTCQTGGRLLADRALSRLLKGDWPRSAEELEAMRRPRERSTGE